MWPKISFDILKSKGTLLYFIEHTSCGTSLALIFAQLRCVGMNFLAGGLSFARVAECKRTNFPADRNTSLYAQNMLITPDPVYLVPVVEVGEIFTFAPPLPYLWSMCRPSGYLIQMNSCLPEQLLSGNWITDEENMQLLPEQLTTHNFLCMCTMLIVK